MKWDPFEGGSNFNANIYPWRIHGTAIFTIHDIHVYLTFIVWYIYLHRIHAWYISVNQCFPAAVSTLNQQMLNPQTTDNPKPFGCKQVVEVEIHDLQNQNLRGKGGGPWTLKFSLRPSSHALTHDATCSVRESWGKSLMSQQQSGALLREILRWLPPFFFAGWKSPMILGSRFHSKKPIQLFNSPVEKKITQDDWVPQFMAPKDSGWGRVSNWAVTLQPGWPFSGHQMDKGSISRWEYQVCSMEFRGSLNRWYRWYIIPQLAI